MRTLRLFIGLTYSKASVGGAECRGLCARIALFSLLSAIVLTSARAQGSSDCAQVDEALRSRIVHVAARMLRTEPLLPTIDQERIVPHSCYRQFYLSLPDSNRHLSLYLSPDLHFLSATLWDVSVEPESVDTQMNSMLTQQSSALHAPTRGPNDARITLVVFSDFQCPYCSEFAEMGEKFRKDSPDKFRLIFRNAPLPAHDWAMPAARAGICISDQDPGAFWKFHDYLFFKQRTISVASLSSTVADFLTETPEVNKEKYSNCIASSFPQNRLEQDMADVRSLDIHGTPVVYINGRRYEGFRDEASFLSAINLAAKLDEARRETGK